MTANGTTLWRDADFLKLWAAQTVSQVGSQITFLALPLSAILLLDATPAQMGLLTALGSVPSLLAGLHAGAMVDRRRRRPVLIAADLGRAVLLALIPLAWVAGRLSLGLVYAVALLGGLLSLAFDVAYQAFLPHILRRELLIEGNSKLELSRTAAEMVGPALAGWLVQLLTAPLAIAGDALSFVGSALLVWRIRVREPAARREARRARTEIGEGLRAVFGNPWLRAIAGGRGVLEFFNAMLEAVVVLYLTRALGLRPALIGVVFAVGSAGFVVGSLLPNRLARRIGLGKATAAALALVGGGDLIVPLAHGSLLVVLPLLIAAEFCFGIGLTIFNVGQASLRQAVVSDRLQGRASATLRVLAAGLVPVGALLGGALGGEIGLRATLVLAAGGELLAAWWLWRSPLRLLRTLPTADDTAGLTTR